MSPRKSQILEKEGKGNNLRRAEVEGNISDGWYIPEGEEERFGGWRRWELWASYRIVQAAWEWATMWRDELSLLDFLCGDGLVTKSCLTLWDPVDCSPPGSSVHGILQARILELVAISFSRGFSQCRNQTWVSYIASRFFTGWGHLMWPTEIQI